MDEKERAGEGIINRLYEATEEQLKLIDSIADKVTRINGEFRVSDSENDLVKKDAPSDLQTKFAIQVEKVKNNNSYLKAVLDRLNQFI